jgi:4-carboxymuconolactone decarboxylase
MAETYREGPVTGGRHAGRRQELAIAAALGTREPPRGQLRIALSSGISKDEIVGLFIHLEAYAGAARAVEMYQISVKVFTETEAR